MLKKVFFLSIFSIISILLLSGTALAHKVIIFAYVEGDTVYTESKFSGGKKVVNGKILVYDLKERELLKGKTDKNGEFFFKIPEKTALNIVLDAGMGHGNSWTIPLSEIENIPENNKEKKEDLHKISLLEQKRELKISAPFLNEKKIEIMIEKALDKKLKPIMRILIEEREKGPDVHDIFSGIGYIFGLAGVASYISFRKRGGSGKL